MGPILKPFLFNLDRPPAILEVGVDRGVSFITLVAFLARCKSEFFALGVDVQVQEQVEIMLANLDLTQTQRASLLQENSLSLLPRLQGQVLFDAILLDGDHNYHTVSQELLHLKGLTEEGSIVIIDDYTGRWGDKDLWYAERPGYEENSHVTLPVPSEKAGVGTAVDDYLATHGDLWEVSRPIHGEPIMLTRKSEKSSTVIIT